MIHDGAALVGAADLDGGAVGADLLANAAQLVDVEAHREDRIVPSDRGDLDQPVLGLDPAGRQQLGHAAELTADERLEAGADLRPDVPSPDGDAEHFPDYFRDLVSGQ